jgi:hypothetical protein
VHAVVGQDSTEIAKIGGLKCMRKVSRKIVFSIIKLKLKHISIQQSFTNRMWEFVRVSRTESMRQRILN